MKRLIVLMLAIALAGNAIAESNLAGHRHKCRLPLVCKPIPPIVVR